MQYGESKESLYTLSHEYNNITDLNENIIFKYPKVENNNDYYIEFFFENKDLVNECTKYYDNIEILSVNYFLSNFNNEQENLIKYDSYKKLENENNLTYLVYCKDVKYLSFNVTIMEKEEGILNEVFLAKKYKKYSFPTISNNNIILIQILSYNYYSSAYFSISNYNAYTKYKTQLYMGSKGDIPKLLIKNEDIFVKITYIDQIVDVSIISTSYNLSFDGKDTFIFSIKPLILNKPIKYTIHIINKNLDLCTKYNMHINNYFLEIYNNFGGLTINQTFTKNESNIFQYKFNVGKIDNTSYQKFEIIAMDLETGYLKDYGCKILEYKYNEENEEKKYYIWILVIIFAILIVIIVLYFFIRRNRKFKSKLTKEKLENKNLSGKLTED